MFLPKQEAESYMLMDKIKAENILIGLYFSLKNKKPRASFCSTCVLMSSSEQLRGQNKKNIPLQYSFCSAWCVSWMKSSCGAVHQWCRGRRSYQWETRLSSNRMSEKSFFCLLIQIAFAVPLALPLARLLIVQMYSGHDKDKISLFRVPFEIQTSFKSCVSFLCPQWDSPQPKPVQTMFTRWPLQCKYNSGSTGLSDGTAEVQRAATVSNLEGGF